MATLKWIVFSALLLCAMCVLAPAAFVLGCLSEAWAYGEYGFAGAAALPTACLSALGVAWASRAAHHPGRP